MITLKKFSSAILLGTLVLGCTTTTPMKNEAPVSAVDARPRSVSPAAEMHVATIMTSDSTLRSVMEVCTVLSTVFGFQQTAMEQSDYFSGGAQAKTADGCMTHAACRSVKEDETEVTIRSDLPAEELAVVVQKLRERLKPYPAVNATSGP